MQKLTCVLCKHYFQGREKAQCAAFPTGIPQKYIYTLTSHSQIVDGQTGTFVFEPSDPEFYDIYFKEEEK